MNTLKRKVLFNSLAKEKELTSGNETLETITACIPRSILTEEPSKKNEGYRGMGMDWGAYSNHS